MVRYTHLILYLNSFLLYILRDTAGQKNFRTIGKTHYSSTRAFVLVYDVTSRETFHLIQEFNQFIEHVC
jgi:GTPase SAR1 family protein